MISFVSEGFRFKFQKSAFFQPQGCKCRQLFSRFSIFSIFLIVIAQFFLISNSVAQVIDADQDGVINNVDLDDDNDGIPDILESGPNLVTGPTIKLDFSQAGDGAGGSLADWNQIFPGTINLATVIRAGDGAVAPGIGVTTNNLQNGNFNNDVVAANWAGADPYYIAAAEDIYFHGLATPLEVTFTGLDVLGMYSLRIHSLIGNSDAQVNTFDVIGAATSSVTNTKGDRWAASSLEDANMVFAGVVPNASGEITMRMSGAPWNIINALVLESSVRVDRDSDGDGISDRLDIDSDNDGIPDNVEAQPSSGYIPPSGIGLTIEDNNSNGLDDSYELLQGGVDLNPVDSEGRGAVDYLDGDSDGDGLPDWFEAGFVAPSGGDTDGDGLLDVYEGGTLVDNDPNDDVNNPATDLTDTDGDCCTTVLQTDLDYRDLSVPQAVLSKTGVARNTNSTTDVAENDLIDWVVRYSNPTGFTLLNVELGDVISGSHTVVSSQFPDGWVFDAGGFSAGQVVGAGFGLSNEFPPVPIASNFNTGGTGGDGFVPIFADNGNIYASYHHKSAVLSCVDPVAGGLCPGYPAGGVPLAPTGVAGLSEGYMLDNGHDIKIVNGKLYYPVVHGPAGQANNLFATFWRVTPIDWGVGCFDVVTQAACTGFGNGGYLALGGAAGLPGGDFANELGGSGIQGPYLYEGNFYLFDYHMRIHCVNPQGGLCGGAYPLDNSDPATFPMILSDAANYNPATLSGKLDGSKLYTVVSYVGKAVVAGSTDLEDYRVRCTDLATASNCVGWPAGGSQIATPGRKPRDGNVTNGGSAYEIFLRRDTSGAVDGVCVFAHAGGVGCVDENGIPIANGPNDFFGVPGAIATTLANISTETGMTHAHAEGNRLYFGVFDVNGNYCWDFSLNDWCAVPVAEDLNGDGFFGVGGFLASPGNSVDYGPNRDPNTGCFWSLGDTNLLWNYDIYGNSPCRIAEVTATQNLTPVQAYCDSGSSALSTADWDVMKLEDVILSDYSQIDVDLFDENDVLLTSCDFKAATCTNGFVISSTGNLHEVNLSNNLGIDTEPTLRAELKALLPLGTIIAADGLSPRLEINWDFVGAPTPVEFCLVTDPDVQCPVSGAEVATNTATARIQGASIPDSTVVANLNVFPVGSPDTKCRMDYGDAPETYGTSLSRAGVSGAGHSILNTANTLFIGTSVDNESDGSPSGAADGDNSDNNNDEQGVTFGSPGGGGRAEVTAAVSVVNDTGGDAIVCAWLDRWDGSGNGSTTFVTGDAQDGGATCQTVPDNDGVASTANFRWQSGLASVSGNTFARFRVCTTASECNTPLGVASDGEVEDYQILFDFTPTAVTVGEVTLKPRSAQGLLAQLGSQQANNESLWALLNSWDQDAAQSLSVSQRSEIEAALLDYLDPDGDGDVAVLTWDTIEERGTIGFYVERNVDGKAAWVRINNDLLPGLINAPLGGEYLLADPEVQSGVPYNFRLVELEATGETRTYGPFPLKIEVAD